MSDFPDQSPETAEPPLAGSPPLQGERVAFTGTLAAMTHKEAFDWVHKNGGQATQNVSRQTTMLVVGEEGWALESDGRASKKLRQVLAWNLDDGDCRVVREADWLHLIGLDERRQDVRREYTPAMLSRLLNVPVNRIRRWETIGLLRAVRSVGRLPLFDYREVTGARRIAELLESGVDENHLRNSVEALRAILPADAASVSDMPVESRAARLLYRDRRGLLEPATGQRCFEFQSETDSDSDESDVEPPPVINFPLASSHECDDALNTRSAEEWFEEGCRLLEDHQPLAAAEAFRLSLLEEPNRPSAHFYLAECLYRAGNRLGALERYYAAVEIDREFVEAWTQIGCVLAELDEPAAALDAFQFALRVHPENPDAHWHIADLLWRRDEKEKAVPHWEAYLERDADGPWAETARQRLDEATTSTDPPASRD